MKVNVALFIKDQYDKPLDEGESATNLSNEYQVDKLFITDIKNRRRSYAIYFVYIFKLNKSIVIAKLFMPFIKYYNLTEVIEIFYYIACFFLSKSKSTYIFISFRLASGLPDLRTCLLNQKLQMLNCCIERRLARENSQLTYDSAEDSSSDDDEFFDCTEKLEENKKKPFIWDQPVGRLSKFRDLKLLKTGDPLYIPITQEPVLKTEDQLEEDTDVLLKLGSNAEATELRARIMSASLLSDMESFKAANPDAIVEDFIRWYSPRDWIEEEEDDEWGQKKGHLSPRMLIEENNIWVQMWETAKPVPASRQKRLFDDTREAEKVLQFLDYRTVAQVCIYYYYATMLAIS